VNPIHSIVEQEAKIHEVLTFPSFLYIKINKKVIFFRSQLQKKNLRVLTKERGNAMKISRISCRVSLSPTNWGGGGVEGEGTRGK
jgi:hypothetical protein